MYIRVTLPVHWKLWGEVRWPYLPHPFLRLLHLLWPPRQRRTSQRPTTKMHQEKWVTLLKVIDERYFCVGDFLSSVVERKDFLHEMVVSGRKLSLRPTLWSKANVVKLLPKMSQIFWLVPSPWPQNILPSINIEVFNSFQHRFSFCNVQNIVSKPIWRRRACQASKQTAKQKLKYGMFFFTRQ